MTTPSPDNVPALLAAIHILPDLQPLVEHLGYTSDLTWLPADGWVERTPPSRAAVIGRRGGFEWLGFEVESDAPDMAARLARRLEQGARLAGVMVLAPRARVLALSVSLPPRPALAIDLTHPAPLALTGLERLRAPAQASTIAIATEVARGLDVEGTGRRFFTTFRRHLEAATRALPPAMPPLDRHAAALLQLTRVLFLYFVQAKGWLDGRPAFLREELDRVLAADGDPHRDLLHPLFFGTLNQPAAHRGQTARRFGRIPFLNGGLFEPHPLERGWRFTLPSAFWRSAFDDLFERFHFTPREGRDDRIAPDMLGRVFEGVMDPGERRGSGTFYTPAPLVQALTRATLAAHLSHRLGCSEAEADRRLDDPDAPTRGVLHSLTILDPACGSGAFLLGALELLTQGLPGPHLASRRQVLARNLFGVDLNPVAVRLSELRLWLALIACDIAEDPAEVAPLPNLDSMVRQGDSLQEPLEPGWGGRLPGGAALKLGALRRRLLVANGAGKREALSALRAAERQAAESMLSSAADLIQYHIRDLLAQGRSATLFGGRSGLDWRQQRWLEAMRGRRRLLWSLRRRLDRDGELPWFHYQSQFSEVFADRGGFDVIIGNPPWVRFEEVAPAARGHLAARYRWYAPGPGTSGYANWPDLSLAFLERAMELAGSGGTVGFLLPAKVATAAYATVARGALASGATIHCAADLRGDRRAVFEATVYPFALVATRGQPDPGHQVRRTLDPASAADLPQDRLSSAPWVLRHPDVRLAQERCLDGQPALGSRFRIHLGVKTGLNDVFLDPGAPVEPELLHWAVRGRDVHPFGVQPKRRLLWTHGANGQPLRALPLLASRYLVGHRVRLQQRRDYIGGPFWTMFRTGPACANHRVIWPDLARRLEACPLTGPRAVDLIPLNTCYLLQADDGPGALRLAAWLNCTWIRALAALTADPAAGGFRRFNAGVIAKLPLPESVHGDRNLGALALAGQAGRLAQTELDEACARHLSLRPRDRDALASVVPPPRATGR